MLFTPPSTKVISRISECIHRYLATINNILLSTWRVLSGHSGRHHLTETPPFCWVIAASPVAQCCKLFDRGRLAVALHYTEFKAIHIPGNFNDTTRVIPTRVGRP